MIPVSNHRTQLHDTWHNNDLCNTHHKTNRTCNLTGMFTKVITNRNAYYTLWGMQHGRKNPTYIGSALGPYLANCTMMFLPSTLRPTQNSKSQHPNLSTKQTGVQQPTIKPIYSLLSLISVLVPHEGETPRVPSPWESSHKIQSRTHLTSEEKVTTQNAQGRAAPHLRSLGMKTSTTLP
jgi:hypothetical protein